MLATMRPPIPFLQSKVLLTSLLFFIALGIGTYIRLFPLLEHTTSDSQEKATLLVLAQLKAQVAQQIERTQPQLGDTEKAVLHQKLFQELLHTQAQRVRDTIATVTSNINRQDDFSRDYPYLLASDSFHFYHLTERVLEKGSISDTFRGSKYHHELMMAPDGFWEPITAHPYVGALVYHTMRVFQKNTPLDYALSFTPLFLTALCLILFFFSGHLLGAHPLAAFTASIFFLLSPIFIKRSTFGWYDNDPYNILFPLLLFIQFWACLFPDINKKKLLIRGALLSATMFLYSLFWQGWVFFFCLLLGCMTGAFIIQSFFFRKQQTSPLLHLILSFFLTTFILISLFFGPKEFMLLFQEGSSALQNFLTPKLSVWPDLYLSVGELHAASLGTILNLLGNIPFLLFAFIGIGSRLINMWQKRDYQSIMITCSLLLWLLSSLYLSLGAQRFALLAFTPMSLFCLIGLHQIYTLLHKHVCQRCKGALYIFSRVLLISSLLGLIIIPIRTIQAQLTSLLNPIYNTTWDKALTQIEKKTPEDAIINTWWPPGHFIKATAKRRVTFDGASINHPQAYWMANVFMSSSEIEAAGILRMLNLSGNRAADKLLEWGLPASEAVVLLKNITKRNQHQAMLLLSTVLKNPQRVQEILSLTHQQPPPSYLLIFTEIVDKNIQFPFIGRWNFKAIEAINADPVKMKAVPPRSSPKYIQFLWQLAGGPLRVSPALSELTRNEEFIVFAEGVQLHRATKDCLITSEKYGQGIPQSIFYLQNDKVVEKKFPDANLPYSLVNVEDGAKHVVYLMDRPLAKSLLVHLHYFHGAGLNYFQPFIHESDLTKRTEIQVFEVDWERFLKDQKKN